MRFGRMISLSPTESQFILHLDAFARSLNPPVDCRIAGGWVRDKVSSGKMVERGGRCFCRSLPIAQTHSAALIAPIA